MPFFETGNFPAIDVLKIVLLVILCNLNDLAFIFHFVKVIAHKNTYIFDFLFKIHLRNFIFLALIFLHALNSLFILYLVRYCFIYAYYLISTMLSTKSLNSILVFI